MQYSACVASIRLLSRGYALHRIAVAVRYVYGAASCVQCAEVRAPVVVARVESGTGQDSIEGGKAGRKGGRGSEGAELAAQHIRERYRESPVVTSAVATAATSARRRLDRHQNRTDQE